MLASLKCEVAAIRLARIRLDSTQGRWAARAGAAVTTIGDGHRLPTPVIRQQPAMAQSAHRQIGRAWVREAMIATFVFIAGLVLGMPNAWAAGTGPVTWGIGAASGNCQTPPYPIGTTGYATPDEAIAVGTAAYLAQGCQITNYVRFTRGGTPPYPNHVVCFDGSLSCIEVGAACPDGSNLTADGACTSATSLATKQLGCDPMCMRGNPVNVGFTNRFIRVADYAGAGSFPLRFERSYNSQVQRPGNVGINWTHTFSRVALFDAVSAPKVVSFVRPDGQILGFLSPDGLTFNADPDVAHRVTQLRAGSQITGWTFQDASTDNIETYDAAGRLTSVASRAGLKHVLTYSDGTANPQTGGVVEGTATPLPAGLLIRVADDMGRALAFGYDAQGRLVRMTDPSGANTVYGIDQSGRLTSVLHPDGKQRVYHYQDTAGSRVYWYTLTGITDENGHRFVSYIYDGNRRESRYHSGAGDVNIWKIDYDGSAGQGIVTNPLGAVTRNQFTQWHGVRLVTAQFDQPCPSCGPQNRTYEPSNGTVLSATDWRGNYSCYAHHATRLLETARGEGLTGSCPADVSNWTPTAGTVQRKTTTDWHATFRLPTQITASGRQTAISYDSKGNVLSRTVTDLASGRTRTSTWTYTYSTTVPGAIEQLVLDGPRTDVADITTYQFYPVSTTCPGASATGCRGQLWKVTDALGHITEVTEYDAHGRPLAIVDPNGLSTTLSWHPRGWLLSRSVGAQVTQYDYDDVGQLTRITAPDGSYTENTYDGAHRLTEIRDSAGNRRAFTLDAMGNRVTEQTLDPGNVLRTSLTREYNSLNRLVKLIGATSPTGQVTQYGYDNQGNLTSIDGPLTGTPNDLTVLGYDALNRMKDVTDPLAGVTRYGYSGLDQVLSVTDPRNNLTSYARNALDEETQEVSPDRGTTGATHDAAGNLLIRTDARGKTATYAYDALNRVTSVSFQDGTSLGFTYDAGTNAKGRLSSTTWPGGTTSFVYDPHGRVLTKTQAHTGGPTRIVRYGWDAVSGQLETITYPSGKVLTVGYDSAGRVDALSIGATVILSGTTYQPFGPPIGWTWGNGQAVSRTFDLDGRITGFELSPASARTLQYDDASRITGIVDPDSAASTHTYGYDRLDRVTSWVQNASSRTYAYDANGNRTSLKIGATTHTYSTPANTNRLAATTGPSPARAFTYDAAGNIIGDGQSTWVYNDRGRMASATKGTTTATYTHDSFGQRVRKTGPTNIVSTGTHHFVYDEAGKLLGEYNSTGGLIQEYVYLNDELVAIVRGGTASPQVFYVYTDQIGRPWTVTNTANQLRWQWDTSPFGEFSANQNPAGLGAFTFRLRFPGQYLDAETGLHYNYFRDYDPQTGRYVQADPIGLAGGLNSYAYVQANPLSGRDPFGLFDTTDFVQRYFFGGGAPVDLGQVGLLQRFRSSPSVSNSTSAFESSVLAEAARRAEQMCNVCTPTGYPASTFQTRDRAATDVTEAGPLYSVGRSSLFRSANCFISPNCASRTFTYSCTLGFGIRDQFADPLRGQETFGRPFEVGGTPYPINGAWNQTSTGSGRF
jgi:RHS repeat-associated protein